jgi:hypothetical protein
MRERVRRELPREIKNYYSFNTQPSHILHAFFWCPKPVLEAYFLPRWVKIVSRARSVRRDGKWSILWSCGRGCSGSRELPPGKGGGTFFY